MSDIFVIVFPVFALAAIGYGCARSGVLSSAGGDGLASFVFNVAIPILLFKSLATAEFSRASPWALWISYLAGILVAWAGAIVLVALIAGRGYRASVIAGVAASFSNLVLVGIPLIERAYGSDGLTVHFLIIAVHLPVMMAIATVLMELAARADDPGSEPFSLVHTLHELLLNFSKNAIIIGIVLGSAWRVTGLSLPSMVLDVMNLIGRTAGPLALIALGASFTKFSIRGNWQPAVGLALLSVVVQPVVVYLFVTQVVSLPVLWMQVAVIAAACPTGVNAYLFATYFNKAQGLASSSIVLAALMSIVTLPLWLSVLAAL